MSLGACRRIQDALCDLGISSTTIQVDDTPWYVRTSADRDTVRNALRAKGLYWGVILSDDAPGD